MYMFSKFCTWFPETQGPHVHVQPLYMRFYTQDFEAWVITREHKLLYLIARKIIPADLDHQKFDIEKFLSGIDLDIDALYAKVRPCYGWKHFEEKGYISRQATIVKSMYEEIFKSQVENQQLASLRDFLLPMLMNGQVKVGIGQK